jgi:hypothetical protein
MSIVVDQKSRLHLLVPGTVYSKHVKQISLGSCGTYTCTGLLNVVYTAVWKAGVFASLH